MRCDRGIVKDKSPSDLKQRDVVQARYDKVFHLFDGCHAPYGTEPELCCTPVLLDKV
jgi:hypothetical protein